MKDSQPIHTPAPVPHGRGPAPVHAGERPLTAWLNRDVLLALGVLGLAAFFFVGATRIRISPVYAHIGPRFFPFLVSTGLALCGAGLLIQAVRDVLQGRRPAPPEGETEDPPLYWGPMLLSLASVVAQIVLLERAGFVISSTVLFAGIAAAFGSRTHLRNAVIGFILSFVTYWAFTQWLGLRLPGGVLRPILAWLGGS